jgi:CarD family transcriptional regulator
MAAKALSFDVGDYVVYPKHGVGRVVELQSTEIAGTSLDLYVLRFEKEKMTLRVPVLKADSVGMRKLSSDKTMKDALETLKGKPKVKRTMWSRRAQEYEAKINSGDLTSIAEVTRDLFRRRMLRSRAIPSVRSSRLLRRAWLASSAPWSRPMKRLRSRRSSRSSTRHGRSTTRPRKSRTPSRSGLFE